MSKEETNWPAPMKTEPSAAGAALRQYEQETNASPNEAASYSRALANIVRPSTRPRWLVAVGATALAVPALLWLLRSKTNPPSIPNHTPSTSVASAPMPAPPKAAPLEASVQLGMIPRELPTGTINLGGGITAALADQTSATARFQKGTLDITLASGSIELHVPPRGIGQAVLVTAGDHRFTVVGTVFTVSHPPHRLDLAVSEGLVAVSNEAGHLATVAAGETWSLALPLSGPRRFAPRISRGTSAKDCTRFAADTQVRERIQCYREQARSRGPDSERAQYELARLLRDGPGDLTAALGAFELQRSRFPRGGLRIEADRAIIELLPRLGRHAEALAETQMFLDEHPDAEYRAEIRLVRGDIFRAIFRDVTSAEREYDEGAEANGRTGDDSRFLRALCLEAMGRMDEARSAYQDYLAQVGTAHAHEAQRRMERLAR